jgi:hypothetical protein
MWELTEAPGQIRHHDRTHSHRQNDSFPAIAAPHSTNEGHQGRVTATEDPVTATATRRLSPRMRRSGWWRRVPMLYGTPRSRPALLPRVCGLTRTSSMPAGPALRTYVAWPRAGRAHALSAAEARRARGITCATGSPSVRSNRTSALAGAQPAYESASRRRRRLT